MFKSVVPTKEGGAVRFLVMAGVLIAVLVLFMPATASAMPPADAPKGAEACASCHAAETTAWQNSFHAKANVSCEACHGAFVPQHVEKKGLMKLDIESASCKTCHAATYDQWKASPHGKWGVQCIGCHLSHSQQFRLTDVSLCGSCHRQVAQDQSHTAHKAAGISCVQCHVSSPDANTVPPHSFTVVAENCVGCHGKSIHEFVSQAKMAPPTPEKVLTAKLEVCEDANKSLLPMTVVNLGLGLGVGGLAGIVFMLVISYVRERRTTR